MTNELLARVAAVYGLADLRAIERRSERVAKVQNAVGTFAVKSFGDANAHIAQLEAAMLSHLGATKACSYRVQRLIPTASGEPSYVDDRWAIVVTTWEDGTSKPYTEIQTTEWHGLGRSLAALHERLASFGPMHEGLAERLAARDAIHARDSMRAVRPKVLAKSPALAERLERYLDDQSALFARHIEGASRPSPVPEQPIHNDYNQHNYLFDGIDPPRILDWDRAIAAPREYDVIRCLNHLPIVAPTCASAFMDGYQNILPLRRAALRWSLDVAMVEHALKRWPIERWLVDLPGSGVQLEGTMTLVRSLASNSQELDDYFASVGGT